MIPPGRSGWPLSAAGRAAKEGSHRGEKPSDRTGRAVLLTGGRGGVMEAASRLACWWAGGRYPAPARTHQANPW